jgi:hypothetical protein
MNPVLKRTHTAIEVEHIETHELDDQKERQHFLE